MSSWLAGGGEEKKKRKAFVSSFPIPHLLHVLNWYCWTYISRKQQRKKPLNKIIPESYTNQGNAIPIIP